MTTTAVEWFKGDVGGQDYSLPTYVMNGHAYVLDAVEAGKLEIDKEAQPRTRDDEQVKRLMASIKKKVLMQPLLVRYNKSKDKYLITEGQHRYYACTALGIERIPCIVYLDMDKALALLCGIEANAEDRAKALSGGDMAAKAFSIIEETRQRLESEWPSDQISESRILQALGHGTKSQMSKYLVSYKVQQILDDSSCVLTGFVADRQDQNTPITTNNLIFFLRRVMRIEPASKPEELLRKEETANLIRLLNSFAKTVLVGKWNPSASGDQEERAHNHAKNICRRHPFEALGMLSAEILKNAGGAHPSGGAAFCKTSNIDWKVAEAQLTNLLNSHAWDTPEISLERSVNEILRRITAIVKF
jgi:ParB/RepB/Spo0J family partition protein